MKEQIDKTFSLSLCGDVMTGRGIDQIFPVSCNPQLYEPFVEDARDYLFLAEQKNQKINYPVNYEYIWGDALSIWQQQQPNVKIINLETAITQCNEYWPDKGINYRMHPLNVAVLEAAKIDVCTIGNNHILDWGYLGLKETIETLKKANIKFTGAGDTLLEAIQPAVCSLGDDKRLLIFSAAHFSSGVPAIWSATTKRPGLFYLDALNKRSLELVKNVIKQYKQANDFVVFSIHWGSNWGYDIPLEFQEFAHDLIDEAYVDLVFGHSSHHFRPLEIYKNKLILYGCGDFINDYEGISGHEIYRGDLVLMYSLKFDYNSLQLKEINLFPLQIKNFRLHSANLSDQIWLMKVINAFRSNVHFQLLDQRLVHSRSSNI